jgi:hypothetical protein
MIIVELLVYDRVSEDGPETKKDDVTKWNLIDFGEFDFKGETAKGQALWY